MRLFVTTFFAIIMVKAAYAFPENPNQQLSVKAAASWGLQYQYISSTLTAKETDTLATQIDNVNMTGAASGVYGFYLLPLDERVSLHLGMGYEPFKVSGTSSIAGCANFTSHQCDADINYVTTRAAIRTIFEKRTYNLWAELGFSLKYPLSSTSTALEQDKITLIHTFDIGVGSDLYLNKKNFVPLSLQYSLFPPSNNVTSSSLYFKLGYGWTL